MAPKEKKQPRVSRRWVVRYDDPDWVPPTAHGHIRGMISQPEVGGQSNRYHHQCYVECTGKTTNKQVAEQLNIPWAGKGEVREHSLHLVAAYGSRPENTAYCGSSRYCHTHSKGDQKMEDDAMVTDETFCDCADAEDKGQQQPPTLSGEWPGTEGGAPAQSGYQEMIADAKAGLGVMAIRRKHAETYVRFHSGVDKVAQAHAACRQWMPAVYWLHGPAGVNKSRMAHAVLKGGTYYKPPDTRWFDGYDGGDVLVLNDLRKSTFTYSYLLDLLDRYEFQVEVKATYTPMLAKVIIITCSKAHSVLWAEHGGTENENLNQLTRRIKEEVCITYENVEEQKRVVTRMRKSVVHWRDSSNWDKEDLFGYWDGEGEVPEIVSSSRERSRSPRRLKSHDDTEPVVKKKDPYEQPAYKFLF